MFRLCVPLDGHPSTAQKYVLFESRPPSVKFSYAFTSRLFLSTSTHERGSKYRSRHSTCASCVEFVLEGDASSRVRCFYLSVLEPLQEPSHISTQLATLMLLTNTPHLYCRGRTRHCLTCRSPFNLFVSCIF